MTAPVRARRRILFVDDEPAVLDALQAVLRRDRDRWDMVFVSDGPRAIAELELEPFDVVVSDLCMPGMDGNAVLTWVRDRQPAAARILLSGQGAAGPVGRSLPVAHQYLSKPCRAEALRGAVARACAPPAEPGDEAVRALMGPVSRLPSPPGTRLALTTVLADPRAGIDDLARVVAGDPALAAKALQLANSAFFRPAREVAAVADAVRHLGLEVFRDLAARDRLAAPAGGGLPGRWSVSAGQARALRRAALAGRLAPGGDDGATAVTAALLADVGALALAAGHPAEYGEVVAQVAAGRPLLDAERAVFGATHAEAGACLLGLWGVPLPVARAVRLHHHPRLLAGDDGLAGAVVHVADALVGAPGAPGGAGAADPGALARLGPDALARLQTLPAAVPIAP